MRKLLLILSILSCLFSQAQPNKWLTSKHKTAACNTNNGTAQGTTAWQSQVPSAFSANTYSLNLDGSSGYISMASNIALGTDGAVSIWFYQTGAAAVILGYSASGNDYIYLSSPTTIDVDTHTGSSGTFACPSRTTSTWYNLIINRVSGVMHVYLDGTESSTGGLSISGTINIDQIGKYSTGGGLWWPGNVAEFRYFSSHLSSTDISNLAAGSAPVTASDTHWKINEGTGISIIDYCTN